jgi:hypothetical protein
MSDTNLQVNLREIENKFKDALADEEKAVPFYQDLKNEIEKTINLLGPKEKPKQNVLYSILMFVEDNLRDETRHREGIKKLLPKIQQILSTVSLSVSSLVNMQQVTIGGLTYNRDDVRKEFVVVGRPDQHISFRDYEKKYFDDQRTLRIHFSGNVATMQSSHSGGYKTTNQDNVVQAITFWILTGVLKPGEIAESEREREGRGEANWLEIFKASGKFYIADNHNQDLSTEDAQKAVRAVSSWVYGGQLKC